MYKSVMIFFFLGFLRYTKNKITSYLDHPKEA